MKIIKPFFSTPIREICSVTSLVHFSCFDKSSEMLELSTLTLPLTTPSANWQTAQMNSDLERSSES